MARPKNSSSTVMLSRQQLENLVGEGGLVCVPKKWLKQLGFDAEQKTYSTGLGVHSDGKEIWTYRDWEEYRSDLLDNFGSRLLLLENAYEGLDKAEADSDADLDAENLRIQMERVSYYRDLVKERTEVLQELKNEAIELGIYDSSMWPQEFPAT